MIYSRQLSDILIVICSDPDESKVPFVHHCFGGTFPLREKRSRSVPLRQQCTKGVPEIRRA